MQGNDAIEQRSEDNPITTDMEAGTVDATGMTQNDDAADVSDTIDSSSTDNTSVITDTGTTTNEDDNPSNGTDSHTHRFWNMSHVRTLLIPMQQIVSAMWRKRPKPPFTL